MLGILRKDLYDTFLIPKKYTCPMDSAFIYVLVCLRF